MASTGAQLLVVEDSAAVRSFAVAALESGGFQVSTAKNGMEALKRLAQTRFAMVISALHLPDVSGTDVAKFCRSAKSVNRDAPILLLVTSSDGREQDRIRTLNLGVIDSVTKPFQPEALLAAVRKRVR